MRCSLKSLTFDGLRTLGIKDIVVAFTYLRNRPEEKKDWIALIVSELTILKVFLNKLTLKPSWCGPAQKHQQGPITCSKWSNNSVQDKGIERGIECIGLFIAQKHQQGPITCSKWSNDLVQDKGTERGIECIGFECFNQVRIERSIGLSRGDPSTSYPCARGVQYNLIWAMR
jgi:hypothetical protein